jgi:hypothetical protein
VGYLPEGGHVLGGVSGSSRDWSARSRYSAMALGWYELHRLPASLYSVVGGISISCRECPKSKPRARAGVRVVDWGTGSRAFLPSWGRCPECLP